MKVLILPEALKEPSGRVVNGKVVSVRRSGVEEPEEQFGWMVRTLFLPFMITNIHRNYISIQNCATQRLEIFTKTLREVNIEFSVEMSSSSKLRKVWKFIRIPLSILAMFLYISKFSVITDLVVYHRTNSNTCSVMIEIQGKRNFCCNRRRN